MDQIIQKPILVLFLIVVLIFTAYSFVLSAPFKTMDDQVSIVDNENIKSFGNTGKIFKTAFFGDRSYYRPLVALSFMIEYHFFGLKPVFYYLTNIFLHCLNTLLVFFLVMRLLRDRPLTYGVTLLFAIHPIHWEAVANIPGRSILLSAFFYLSAFTAVNDAHEIGIDSTLHLFL